MTEDPRTDPDYGPAGPEPYAVHVALHRATERPGREPYAHSVKPEGEVVSTHLMANAELGQLNREIVHYGSRRRGWDMLSNVPTHVRGLSNAMDAATGNANLFHFEEPDYSIHSFNFDPRYETDLNHTQHAYVARRYNSATRTANAELVK